MMLSTHHSLIKQEKQLRKNGKVEKEIQTITKEQYILHSLNTHTINFN